MNLNQGNIVRMFYSHDSKSLYDEKLYMYSYCAMTERQWTYTETQNILQRKNQFQMQQWEEKYTSVLERFIILVSKFWFVSALRTMSSKH